MLDTAMIAMNTMRRVMSIMSNATSHRKLSTIKNTKVEIQESSEIIVLGPSIVSKLFLYSYKKITAKIS